MGTFGVKLYDDDYTCDVRDEYINQLKETKDNILSTQNTIDMMYYNDSDEGHLFFLALADTQWDYGRLLDEIKEKALEVITDGLDRWKDNNLQYKKRLEILNKLKEKLLSTQPKEKRIVVRKPFVVDWKENDVFVYRLESDLAKENELHGRYIIIHMLELVDDYGSLQPLVRVKITNNCDMPKTIEDINKAKYIRMGVGNLSWAYSLHKLPIPSEEELRGCYDEYGDLPIYEAIYSINSKQSYQKTHIYMGNFNNIEKPEIEFKKPIKAENFTFIPKSMERLMIKKYIFYKNKNI